MLCAVRVKAENLPSAFEAANKLYEQGQFAQAAEAYQRLIQSGHVSASLYFNAGNAFFKAGQNGQAIAAYQQAQDLTPRDPAVRFNLQHVRKKATGSDTVSGSAWERWLSTLTLDEWTVLSMGAWWIWFLLLSLREYRPSVTKALQGYTATAGLLAVLLGGCLAASVYQKSNGNAAVAVVPDAVVRYGPLEESQVYFQLRDGAEVTVLDRKEVSSADQKQAWLQVRDSARRIGWLKSDQVVRLAPDMTGTERRRAQ